MPSAIAWKPARLSAADLDSVVFYDKPFLKFERLLETYLMFAPSGFASFRMAVPLWIREKLFQKDLLQSHLKEFAPQNRLGRETSLHRTPLKPCRQRFLSFAV